jgi:hypothetical protein
MREKTKEEAARAAGITDATMSRNLANPDFMAAYRAARRQAFDEGLCALEKGVLKAAQRLVDEIDDATASTLQRSQVFINGAKAIIDRAFKAKLAIEIEEEQAESRELMAQIKANYVATSAEEPRIAKD